jgi:hypothetical protein
VQESLFEALSTARRAGVHGRIGEELEALLGDDAEEQAAELAYHFVEAAQLDGTQAARALRYSKIAARQAEAQYAMHDAARLYGAALALVQGSRPTLGEHEAPLLVALGAVDASRGASRSGAEHYLAGIALFRKQQRHREAAVATLEVLYHYDVFQVVHLGQLQMTRLQLASDALEGLNDDDAPLRARLLAELITESNDEGDEELADEARALAREHGLPDVEGRLDRRRAMQALSESGGEAFRSWLLKSKQRFLDAGEILSATNTWCLATGVRLARGHLDEAHTDIDGLVWFAREHGFSGQTTASLASRALIALARDERLEYQELLDSMPLSTRQSAPRALVEARRAELDGDLRRARQFLEDVDPEAAFPEPWMAGGRARLALLAGDEQTARAQFTVWERFQDPPAGTLEPLARLGSAVLLASRERRAELLDQATQQGGVRFYAGRSIDWIRGELALSLDRLDAAEKHFRVGLTWCERERCSVDAALNLQGLAEVADRRGGAQKRWATSKPPVRCSRPTTRRCCWRRRGHE